MDSCGLHEHQEVGRGCGCAWRLLVCCWRLWRDVAFEYRYPAGTQQWHDQQRQILFVQKCMCSSCGMNINNIHGLFPCLSAFSGTLQPSREPLAHGVPDGNEEEAPRLCRLSGHDLLCWGQRWHHGAEQRWALQPQDQPVVSCGGYDLQTKWGE